MVLVEKIAPREDKGVFHYQLPVLPTGCLERLVSGEATETDVLELETTIGLLRERQAGHYGVAWLIDADGKAVVCTQDKAVTTVKYGKDGGDFLTACLMNGLNLALNNAAIPREKSESVALVRRKLITAIFTGNDQPRKDRLSKLMEGESKALTAWLDLGGLL